MGRLPYICMYLTFFFVGAFVISAASEIFNLAEAWQAIFCFLLIVLPWLCVHLYEIHTNREQHYNPYFVINKKVARNRKNALAVAKMYLRPYENIWNNLKLFNKQCQISFDNGMINCYNVSSGSYVASFKILNFGSQNPDDVFDKLCYSFNYQTTYEKVLNFCKEMSLNVIENDKIKNTQQFTERLDSEKQNVEDNKSVNESKKQQMPKRNNERNIDL